jgi:HD-GYP domain-containing protein (c-di-GMP phosphodiesterase class II)
VAARLAGLLVGLSRLADLGFGLEMGTALRSCALAARLARSLDLPDADVQAAFYSAFLHHVGCVGYARETADLFGDELIANAAAGRTDAASPRDLVATFLPALLRARPPGQRARLVLAAVTRGGRWADEFTTAACEIGRDSARRLGLPATVQVSLSHVYDLWRRPRGDGTPVGARIARLIGIAVLFESIGGPELAVTAVRRRAGGMLDPGLVERFTRHAERWFAELAAADARAAVLDLEPRPHVTVADVRAVAEVFGDLADLKSRHLAGHSRAVAALAAGAAERLGLPADAAGELELAGLLHDLGRVGVSTAIWDKPSPWSAHEWEQARLHPYYSERILAASTELAGLAAIVGRHHERLDGSGYHRGSTEDDLSLATRVLAAADAFRTATEPRAHRPPLPLDRARARLLDQAEQGRLDADAVRAVLAAAGQEVPRTTRRLPRGLSDREAQVLRLIARGLSNAEIAARLVISRRTAEHHVQHIYSKIGVSSRAAATLFAVEHHLLDRDG